jgi:pilus assembly protein CpaC
MILLFLLFFFTYPSCGHSEEFPSVLRVVLGQSRVVEIPGVVQIAIGDARIADVKVLPSSKEILLSGIREGMTSLTVWTKEGKKDLLVRVMRTDPRILYDDLTEMLKEIPGVEVKIVGERVLITGKVLRSQDYTKVMAISRLYPDLLFFVEPNLVDLDLMVRLYIQLIEMDRRTALNLGFTYPDTLGMKGTFQGEGKALPGLGPFSGSIVLSSELFSAIHLLLSKSKARILANPTLVAKNGKPASFHAGGEIPVPVQSGLGQATIEWKPFGIRLEVLPFVDIQQNYNLSITVEVSDLDMGNAIKTSLGTIPAVKTRSTTSIVNLTQGESLVISELVDRREGKTVGMVPGLGSLPIVGELFRSRDMEWQEKEVYLIVTPTLLRPGSIPKEEGKEPQERYRNYEEEVGPEWVE